MYDVTVLPAAMKELRKLPPTLSASIADALKALEIYGAALQDPQVRYVGNGIREVRVTSLEGLGRAFYFLCRVAAFMSCISCIRKRLKRRFRI